MKYLEPHNRHLWIKLIEEEKKEKKSAVLLPDDYKPKESEFAVVKVKDSAPDCSHRWPRGEKVIVEKRMIRKVDLGDDIFHVILENYVLGIVKWETNYSKGETFA